MCLACEMDAWWFAEMERTASATPPGSAGVPPALSDSPASPATGSLEEVGGTPARPPFICEETRSE
jgi:hypothetical protein